MEADCFLIPFAYPLKTLMRSNMQNTGFLQMACGTDSSPLCISSQVAGWQQGSHFQPSSIKVRLAFGTELLWHWEGRMQCCRRLFFLAPVTDGSYERKEDWRGHWSRDAQVFQSWGLTRCHFGAQDFIPHVQLRGQVETLKQHHHLCGLNNRLLYHVLVR